MPSWVWWRTLIIPVLGRMRLEDRRFMASLSYLVRPCFKIKNKKEPGVVAHACNPSTWEAETGGSGFAASLSYSVRPSAT